MRNQAIASDDFDVVAGEEAEGVFSNKEANFPLRFGYTYTRNARVEVQSVEFERVE